MFIIRVVPLSFMSRNVFTFGYNAGMTPRSFAEPGYTANFRINLLSLLNGLASLQRIFLQASIEKVSQSGQHLAKLKIFQLRFPENPLVFFKRHFRNPRPIRRPDNKKGTLARLCERIILGPNLACLVEFVVYLRIRQVAGDANHLCAILGWHIIRLLILGMHRRIALEPGTFLFEDLPLDQFGRVIDDLENAVGTDGHPWTLVAFQKSVLFEDVFRVFLGRLGFTKPRLERMARVRFVVGSPMRRFVATKGNPNFFDEHLFGRTLGIETYGTAKLRSRDAIFARLEPKL